MKKLWKMGTMALALAVGVTAGAAMAASGAPAQQVEGAPGAQALWCPTPAQCDRADRLCLDYELTPQQCEILTLCIECGVEW
ncbi:hypothetical protein [Hyalangium gracile]|uniref:hypothetical protein n=1 Tax=Hyalangium gracile TaxID=394092 RepID=UPI001CCD4C33|nr:hypothetical protein [Hyalangium gracile]